MKKVVFMIIPALICGVMFTNCKRAEQKDSLALTSEVVSRENVEYEALVKWVSDSIKKRASKVTNNEVVLADKEKYKIVSRENVEYEALVKWVSDSIKKKYSRVE